MGYIWDGPFTIGDILGSTDWVNWGRSTIRHSATFPVGTGDIPPVDTASTGLPQLVPEPTTVYNLPLPPPLDRRDTPQKPPPIYPDPEVSLTTEQLSDAQWLVQMGMLDDVANYVPPYVAPTTDGGFDIQGEYDPTMPAGAQSLLPPTDEGDDVGWISDVYDIVDTAAGGWLPGGVPVGTSGPGALMNYVGQPGTPVPAIQGPVTMGTDDSMKGMVYKKVCGQYKWVKVKRRRRRALVTQTDLRGLAALKGVLGQGKAFEVWIATHS